MRPFDHDQLAGRVVFGSGRLRELPVEVDRLATTRVLLVTGRTNPARTDRVHKLLGRRWVADVDDLKPHVLSESADAASDRARAIEADLIVSIGGGSATGLAKAIARRTHIPVLAVPTTFAGSEMTPFCGETTAGRKTVHRDEVVLPRTVVYDPELTTSLPSRLAGSSAMNAIAHCIEATYTAADNPITLASATRALGLLTRNLVALVDDPADLLAREEAMFGAHLAGSVVAAAGMSIHHRVCHVLGGMYDLPHAYMNAAVLPHAVAAVAAADPAALLPAARTLNTDDVARTLFALAGSASLNASLADLGMLRADVIAAIEPCVGATAVDRTPLDAASAEALLMAAWSGREPSP